MLTAAPSRPEGVVLLLHGGGGRRTRMMVSPAQLSVLRMLPVAWRVRAAGRGRLVVGRVLNSWRGWDVTRTPVADVDWALGQVRERFGDLPACLVGHSLGGRAAVLAGDRPQVRGVVALAPWVHADDGAAVRGRRVLVVHGGRDRIASEQRAQAMSRGLATRNEVGFVRVDRARHALLREHGLVDALAADFCRTVLLDEPAREPVLRRVLGGEALVRV